jgi:hypothetical protein
MQKIALTALLASTAFLAYQSAQAQLVNLSQFSRDLAIDTVPGNGIPPSPCCGGDESDSGGGDESDSGGDSDGYESSDEGASIEIQVRFVDIGGPVHYLYYSSGFADGEKQVNVNTTGNDCEDVANNVLEAYPDFAQQILNAYQDPSIAVNFIVTVVDGNGTLLRYQGCGAY